MTRKDYELLSESIKGCLPNLEGDDRYDVLTVVNAIANGLSADNKAFDSYRFISDCGLAGWCTNCGQEETPNCNNAGCDDDPVYTMPFGVDLEESLDKLTIRRNAE